MDVATGEARFVCVSLTVVSTIRTKLSPTFFAVESVGDDNFAPFSSLLSISHFVLIVKSSFHFVSTCHSKIRRNHDQKVIHSALYYCMILSLCSEYSWIAYLWEPRIMQKVTLTSTSTKLLS